MPSKAEVRAEAERLQAAFLDAGAVVFETDILLPADTLLDLYGEDIRARAYVTYDPLNGEQMLRPDFTVPVVQRHMADGADPARYTYLGEVFRRQESFGNRAREYLQLGYEVFDRANPAGADAEVFALFSELLSPLGLRATTGDIGILKAAVAGLSTSDKRKAALARHIWRPRRFRALLDRFGGRKPAPPSRTALLAKAQPLDASAPLIGLRTEAEIADRIEALREDAAEPPIGAAEVELLEDIVRLREKSPEALEHLRDLAVDLPAISHAVARMARRLDALDQRGIDVSTLDFEASHGRTTMEYYDGFVFGFAAENRPDMPPVATGGRYDAMTAVLGQGRSIPAVGGVIRPALVAELRRAGA